MKVKNRSIIFFICFILILNNGLFISKAEEFHVDAKSAILIDAGSGKVIYEKNSHDKLPPASVTKIMTMLLAMEAIDQGKISLKDQVTISERASSMGGSQLYLEPGESKSVDQLLKGIAVASANDACIGLAEYISGTEETFVQKMNKRAKELGMNDTQFMNTNGLPQEGHYTSAYDISIMSRELLKYPKIHEYLTIWMSTMKVGLPNKKETNLQLTNTNKLIRTYPGANGIKTGFTSDAKYCLSGSATKNGLTLIAVVLGCETSSIRFEEAKKLLNYGFASYSSVSIAKKNQIMDEVKVEKGNKEKVMVMTKESVNTLVKKGEENKVQKEIIVPKSIKAPVKKNQKIGEIILTKDGTEIGRVDLVAKEEIKPASFRNIFKKILLKTVQ
ncbi:D-alanyl-D-alanine carboxypeptidase family protein [Inediibacterium massiliense]|uniref:D-alanyl-D-alanine carboxypeptidase family protein n=1 Tax=Inediibacterium massiliense TaxID=1658111 RepID=UPI0006B552A1|nr:D-alanyl-D-alanine carboxypeptidase family protein [Inediibacterium massiliense]